MEQLGEQSLLRQEAGPDAEPRFTMLETIREFGLEQLADSGEEGAVQDAHAAHYAALGDEARRDWVVQPGPFIVALEADADNLRAALASAEHQKATDIGLRLGLAFDIWREAPGMLSEGRAWWQSLLVLPGGTPSLRARSLTHLGWLAAYQGDFDVAADAGEQAVALAAEPDWIRANALGVRGMVEFSRGAAGTAQRWIEEALYLLRANCSDGAVMVPDLLMHLVS